MTVEDYMKLPKKRLAELLAERDKLGGIVLPLNPAWKPTEEQLRILGYLAKSLDVASHERHVIDDMIDDLKKLM